MKQKIEKCEKASALRCLNCKNELCDTKKITEILSNLNLLTSKSINPDGWQ